MQHLELWRLGTDILLLLSLFWLGARFLRSPSTARAQREVTDLAEGLKGLIKDADGCGRTLDEQLQRRQQGLERLLSEFEGAELRLSKSVATAEAAKRSLEEHSQKVEKVIRDNQSLAAEALVEEEQQAPEPPSFKAVVAQAAPPVMASQRRPASPAVNIYGEKIASAEDASPPLPIRAAAPAQRSYARATQRYLGGIAKQVEREVVPEERSVPRENSLGEIEEVYSAAEKLLRAGRSIERAAGQGRSTVGGVVRSEPVVQEVQEVAVPEVMDVRDSSIESDTVPSDARLGVLGGIKRQVQVL